MKENVKVILATLFSLLFALSGNAGHIVRSYCKNGIDFYERIEDNGYRWIKIWDSKRNIRGAQTQSGTTIIPLTRNYHDIFYRPEADHPDGGYFSVDKDMYKFKGVVDIHGREIISPDLYSNVTWYDGKYIAKRSESNDLVYISHTAGNSNTIATSNTPNSLESHTLKIDEFKLSCFGEISVLENHQLKTVKPYERYEIHFKLTNNGLFINCPIIGEIKMTEASLLEDEIRNVISYGIKSKDSSFIIGKHKETSLSNMWKLSLMFSKNDECYHMSNATVLFFLSNNRTEFADQALHACTINEDMLIKFMKSLFATN